MRSLFNAETAEIAEESHIILRDLGDLRVKISLIPSPQM